MNNDADSVFKWKSLEVFCGVWVKPFLLWKLSSINLVSCTHGLAIVREFSIRNSLPPKKKTPCICIVISITSFTRSWSLLTMTFSSNDVNLSPKLSWWFYSITYQIMTATSDTIRNIITVVNGVRFVSMLLRTLSKTISSWNPIQLVDNAMNSG
jgi:hypothetical protein